MAMSMATGAMGSLLPKLVELLRDEYKLKESVKEGVRSLEKEMKSMQAALRKVGEVPGDQLDEQVKIWAGEVRELSFDMEDVVDKFLVRVDDGSEPAANPKKLKRLTKMMAGLFTKGKARHEIADAIKSIKKQVQEVADRRARYNVDSFVTRPAAVTPIDPRLGAMYKEVTDLVGITGTRDQEIMKLLSEGDDMSNKNLKIVSVVGFGGLGKTTLVKKVYDKIEGNYDCTAFVPVGRKTEARKVFTDILLNLGMKASQLVMLDEKLLIDKLREFLKNKRYLIVIDDIWDEELWIVIKCAFSSSNNFGSRLITTTRIVSVSESCCSSTNDSVYQMEPLSDEDSKRLFCKRIFSSESWCPPELETVSRDILKKCGGVPLAIITIASLLASGQQVKPKNEWHVLLESIGRGLTENRSVKEMLRILSFSYYDLPSHLKTCLLYLSMFPEDQEIMKDQLIWMWIAEGFVHCGVANTSVFEMGETYFNELVNRSLIQPVYDDIGVFVHACRVHDSVLDLICSLSREENFVTVVNGTSDSMSFHNNIRRLSLQSARKVEEETMPLGYESTKKMRSVVIFKHGAGLPFSNFIVLRVLDILGYDGFKCHLNIRELCSLIHLRYLRLPRQHLYELPEEIGRLQFLQVLDMSGGVILPSTLIKLTRLMCLCLHDWSSRLPDGIGNLKSMEMMGMISVDSVSIVTELGNMDKLRELNITFESLGLVEAFVESLRKMRRIRHLEVGVNCEGEIEVSMDLLGERWVPPETIQKFIMSQGTILSKLPAWNPYHLSQLSNLQLCVQEVGQEDLGFLGMLPALRYLGLLIRRQMPLVISAEEFCCLETLYLISNSPTQILFQPGALTKAKEVMFCIRLPLAKEEAAGNGGDWLEVGMGNLPSLCNVIVRVGYCGLTVGEARQAKAALKNVHRAHPNSPTFKIYFVPKIPNGANDDDICSKEGVLDGYGSDYSSEDVCSEDANDDDACSEDGV